MLGSDEPDDDTELRLCMEDSVDMAESPEAVESVMLGAGDNPTRRECRLDTSSVSNIHSLISCIIMSVLYFSTSPMSVLYF